MLGDHLIDSYAVDSCSFFQCFLEYCATHSSINHRVPVHQSYFAGSKCLTKLVHSGTGLLAGGTGYGSKVGNTLDGLHRSVQINTSSGKRADVLGHFGKVVDGLIRILVKLIKSGIDLINSGSLAFSIRQDRLNRVYLGLVFLKTANERSDAELFSEPTTQTYDLSSDIRNHGCCDDIKRFKTHVDFVQAIANRS